MRTDFTPNFKQPHFLTMQALVCLGLIGLLATSIFSTRVYAQSCPNVDFSAGTFANWQGRTGTCCPINLPTPGFVAGRHTIIAAPGTDPNTCGGLVLPATGFNQVARLGNAVNGAQAEGLSYTLVVDPTNALFIYTYAVVLEDPGHSVVDQPRFELQVRDQFNNIIPCTFYEVSAGAGIPGFNTCGGVVWKNWEQVGVDLTAFMGQTVTIEARTGDCDLGGHFGYGYLVGQCMPLAIDLAFCSGASANLTAPNGFASYLWSTGETTQSINIANPVVGQVVTCTVTSVTGCQAVLNVTLNPITVTGTITSSTNVSCYGGTNGSATVSATGGTGPYTYAWTPYGGNATTATGLGAGTYTVTISETSNSCTGTATVTITQPAAALTSTGTPTPVNCLGGNNGTINLTPSGGTAPYSFLWNNGATTEDVTGLTAGNYSVTTTDANGCTTSYTTTITQPASAVAVNGTSTNVLCFGGNTGTIDITPTGGTPGYTYLWSNGATTQDLNGLSIGSYNVIVTDANGCTNNAFTANITQPAAALAVSGVSTNVLCFGGNTGTIDITPSGGTPGYTYLWSNGATTQDLNSLSLGNYNVVVTDANGCTNNAFTANITQPAAALAVVGISTNVLCFGGNTGTVDITPSGGTPGYTYLWSSGATTQDINSLPIGNYNVVVTDANGCTNNAFTASITQPAAALAVAGISTNVLCFGGNTGTIDITPTGGTPGYTYVWNNGDTSQDLNSLAIGSYNVTVTDANGCTNNAFTANITQPAAALAIAGVSTNVLCFGGNTGTVDITPSGGTPGYTYAWSNGATTQDINGLAIGSYNVTVTDANGCTNNSFTANITQPAAALTVTGVSSNVLCYGGNTGSIDITPSGGTPGYTYLWNIGANTQDLNALSIGGYNVTVTDANGCTNNSFTATITQPAAALAVTGISTQVLCYGGNTGTINITPSGGTPAYTYVWSNGATTQDLNSLSIGTYQVVITDANGCTNNSFSATITQPVAPLTVTGTSTNALCYNGNSGTINITPSGGTPAYTYLWSNGAITQNLNSLGAGTYNVVVTDANGCTYNGFSATINQPSVLIVNGNATNPSCNGSMNGSIDINASGGASPYSYNWSNGSGDEDIYNLMGGSYSVQVTDANGCPADGAWIVVDPPAINIISTVQPNSCVGVNNGYIHLNVSGGAAPYTILWNNGSTANSLVNLGPGNYSVTITDSHGCSNTGSFTLTPVAPITVNLDSIYSIWLGESVQLNAIASGGTGSLTYSWGPTDYLSCTTCASTEASPILNTTYAVTVTDQNGCTAVATAYIEIMYALYIPNTFTPNGDGDNDVFYAISGSVKKFNMRIFDRWGEEIFNSYNIHEGWDGDYRSIEAKQDVYTYRVEATFVNGKYEEVIGQVNLLR
jgi:gliding motility-associated-like protein